MKITIITNIPSPYRIPLFALLDREFQSRGWELTVIFLTKSYHRRKWKSNDDKLTFRYIFLDDYKINFSESFFTFGFSLPHILFMEKPDVIILGGFSFPMLLAIFYSRLFNTPYCLWSGETIQQSQMRKDFMNLRHSIRYWMVQHASAAAVYGKAAKQYMITLDLPVENIFSAINTVDTGFFEHHCMDYRLKKEVLKQQYKYPKINLLYVGHLTEQKGLQYLLQAIKNIKDFETNVALHIVGSGLYEEKLKSLHNELNLQNVYFHGFKQKDELPFYYGICDIFVFPSLYDIWGLVCIEAMASRIPVICSIHCGISHDLIHEYNALLVDPMEINEFSSAIQKLMMSSDLRNKLSENGFDSIRKTYNLIETVNGLIATISSLN
jgi:glycosyltransferase involved in cell wall biosynthesis